MKKGRGRRPCLLDTEPYLLEEDVIGNFIRP